MLKIDEMDGDEEPSLFMVTSPDGVRLAARSVEQWLQVPGVAEWVGYMIANQIRTLVDHGHSSVDMHDNHQRR